jgi:hypothetical protein
MTLVSDIVQAAYRESNIVGIGQSPNTAQVTEGLSKLQRLVKSVYGNEAGDLLMAFPLGRDNITTPQGYPWYDNDLPGSIFLMTNLRVMCNLTGPGLVNLHPSPDDGARMGVVDVVGNFATNPLTINGNGRNIEDTNSITMTTDGDAREWFYRNDLGNWMKTTNLVLTDTFPFPEEFDDMFIITLAARINPSYGKGLDPASSDMLKRSRNQFRARYAQLTQVPSELALRRLTTDYYRWGWYNTEADPSALWNSGYPYV